MRKPIAFLLTYIFFCLAGAAGAIFRPFNRSVSISSSDSSPKTDEGAVRTFNPGRVIIPNRQRPEVLNHFDEDIEDDPLAPIEVDENEEVEAAKEVPGFKRNAIVIGVAMGSLAVGVIVYSLYLSKKDS